MTDARPNPFPHLVRHLVGGVSAAALTDGQLLERFLADRDETAVEVLVRRYGPLVFGVCRRVLHDAHAAEDAFQATFLVLVRRAPSLDLGRPLGSWLYTVAYRLALTARSNERRRQRCEEQAARRRPTAGPDAAPTDLAVALEEELHRLPERHRAPLVLCYLDGKTNDQAAAILGCPRGSMAARLARARERLRECLARRGFVAPAAEVAAALAPSAARAAVPLPLLENTVRAAVWFARDGACAAGVVSAQAVALARGAVRAMFLQKLRVGAATLLAVAMLGSGATMLLKAAPESGLPTGVVGQPPSQPRPQPADLPGVAPDRAANAAFHYGQAFIALRRGTSEPAKLSAECLTMPLDAHAQELVTRAAYALRMMQRGAALPRCDWAIDKEQGVAVPFTHGDGALVLSSVACLRARMRFEEGRAAEAIEDVVAALTLARHVSQDGTLDGLWGGYQVEHLMSEALARYLPGIDAQTTKALKARLDALPPGGSVATATMRVEDSMLNWVVGEVREAKDRENLLDFLSQLAGFKSDAPQKNRAVGRALLADCGGTADGVVKFAEEMRPGCALLAKALDLPPDQVDKEFEREEAKQSGNPVFQVFAPVLHNVRVRQARADIRRALLGAALAVRLDGLNDLKNHLDPVVGGPFEYVAYDGGFELRSKWKVDETQRVRWKLDPTEPLVLTVGRRGQ
jgi:RNA polymerase sigma factor (sigma-70 family)